METRTCIRQEVQPIYNFYKLAYENTEEWYERASLQNPKPFLVLAVGNVDAYKVDYDSGYDIIVDGFGYNQCGYLNLNR